MLTETQIRNAKSKPKEYALDDGGGLFLFIMPSGSKIWRFRYTMNGKQKRVTIGKYPVFSAHEARKQASELQSKIAHGVDPAVIPKVVTFENVACEWLKTRLAPTVTEKRAKFCAALFKRHVFPYIGDTPIHRGSYRQAAVVGLASY